MADYDNGLPPAGISVKDISLNNIAINSIMKSDNEIAENISGIQINSSAIMAKEEKHAASIILINTAKTGINYATFL